jgi:hypothetical protein
MPSHRRSKLCPRIRLSLVPIILFSLLTMEVRATDINWNSTIGANNQTSVGEGTPMGAGFIFELGAFANDFVPTTSNVAFWATNWVALDRDAYNPTSNFFTSKATLLSNDPPFHFTKKAYVWGYNPQLPGEWILMTNSAWSWPFAGEGIQPPVTWSIGAVGTTAVIGMVNGIGFQMKTAFVPVGSIPAVNPDAWRQQYFSTAERANPAISGWQADADGDGASNLFELAAGSNPRNGASSPSFVVERVDTGSGSPFIQFRLQCPQRAAGNYGAEVTPDLTGWSGSGVTIVPETPGEIVFRFPVGTGGRMFMRMVFTL